MQPITNILTTIELKLIDDHWITDSTNNQHPYNNRVKLIDDHWMKDQ